MNDYHINVFYSDEDGGYVADIRDLEACLARLSSRRRHTAGLRLSAHRRT